MLTWGAAACSDAKEKNAADIKKDLSASLQRNGDELSEEAAGCYANAIIAELGIEKLQEVDLSDHEPKGGLDEDIAAAAVRADTECDPSGSGG